MAFSSFGDWLGLLATTALAQQLAGGDYATANFAIAGVFIARLLPSVILGPLAGVIADKFDRKKVMIVGDILRALLFISIPIVGNYFWLYAATVLIECVTLFWSPAKEATVPNLVPKNRLENANQVSLFVGNELVFGETSFVCFQDGQCANQVNDIISGSNRIRRQGSGVNSNLHVEDSFELWLHQPPLYTLSHPAQQRAQPLVPQNELNSLQGSDPARLPRFG